MGIVSTAAFAVGASAVPTPITEIEWEGWMWHQYFSLHVSQATESTRLHFMIDTKAMRKLNSDETVMAAMEHTISGSTGMSVRLGTRMLLMLP